MAWGESRQAIPRDVLRAGIFWTADLLEAANELVPLIRSRRPQVLITYNEFGGYGHPDHIQAHRVAMYGYLLAGVAELPARPGRAVDRVAGAVDHHERVPDAGGHPGAARRPGTPRPSRASTRTARCRRWSSEDAAIAVDDRRHRWVEQKLDAMRAHATQITPDGFFFAAEPISGIACGRTSTTGSPPGSPSRTPTAGPTTSSPAWTD